MEQSTRRTTKLLLSRLTPAPRTRRRPQSRPRFRLPRQAPLEPKLIRPLLLLLRRPRRAGCRNAVDLGRGRGLVNRPTSDESRPARHHRPRRRTPFPGDSITTRQAGPGELGFLFVSYIDNAFRLGLVSLPELIFSRTVRRFCVDHRVRIPMKIQSTMTLVVFLI